MTKQGAALWVSATLLLVAACSAEPGTGPAGQKNSGASANIASEAAGYVRLSGQDIRTTGADGSRVLFGSSREETEQAVTAALGAPQGRSDNGECGAGPMSFTTYRGGLMLNFQRGNLVGWFLRGADKGGKAATPEGISVGSNFADLSAVYKAQALPDSTLGAEYATDEGIGFFLEEQQAAGNSAGARRIDSLYAGVNCFFR